jgi:hypothetical protein
LFNQPTSAAMRERRKQLLKHGLRDEDPAREIQPQRFAKVI